MFCYYWDNRFKMSWYTKQMFMEMQRLQQGVKIFQEHHNFVVGDTRIEELLAFFGLVINMGLIQVSSIQEYWNTRNESQSVPYFRKVFSYNRFNMLQTTFHFPEGDDQNAKMKKVKYIVKYFSSRFQRFYYMKQNVSIDESLIGFQGRAPGIQYLPNKHHHLFGFKIFCLCESDTGYTWNFSMYSGSSKEDVRYGHSHDVCVELMSPLSGQGYHLFTDHFYTSVPIAISLLLHKIDLTGTVRGNRKYLPPGVKKNRAKLRKVILLCISLIKMILLY